MTLVMKDQSRLLVVQNDYIVRSNCEITGPTISTLAGVLLDKSVTSCYITGTGLFEILAEVNALFQSRVPGWRMRITTRRRTAFEVNGTKRIVGRFFVDYFCIDEKRDKEREPRRRFDIVNLDLLAEKPPTDPDEQMAMATAILNLCKARGVKFRATRGGIGNAMLKASPNWQEGRYAAPLFINSQARTSLPGNFYSVSNKVTRISAIPHCYYLDQSSAHHTIAKEVPTPHPQHIHARGNYRAALSGEYVKWLSNLEGHNGLVFCRVSISTVGPNSVHLYPPWAQTKGTKNVWLWTPELRLFEGDHRLQLEGIGAALTATIDDPVLPEYATFSLNQLSVSENPKYIKGTLLAAYGMLAFNSENVRLFRYWGGVNKKVKVDLPVAGNVGESQITIPPQVQASTVNVAARGIIEAETRTRSLEYAKELHSFGYHIPQIYADGILVETNQLPFIPEGWRVTHSLNNVYIPRANALVSDSLVKMPGHPRSEPDNEYVAKREDARRVLLVSNVT